MAMGKVAVFLTCQIQVKPTIKIIPKKNEVPFLTFLARCHEKSSTCKYLILNRKKNSYICRISHVVLSMKKIPALLVLIAFAGTLVRAQSQEAIRVKSGEKLPTTAHYQYPKFVQGTVHLRNGQTPVVPLNYHLLLREIQFINPIGDTLTLANVHTVRQINLNNEVFVYGQNNNVLQVLADYGSVKLAQNHSLQVANVDKEVAYGQSSSLSSVNSYSSYPTASGAIAKLEMKGDVVYSHRYLLFLIDQNGMALAPTRKAVLKMFPKHKSAIVEYIQAHSVRFNEAEDLRQLLAFCTSLN